MATNSEAMAVLEQTVTKTDRDMEGPRGLELTGWGVLARKGRSPSTPHHPLGDRLLGCIPHPGWRSRKWGVQGSSLCQVTALHTPAGSFPSQATHPSTQLESASS